MSVYLTLSQVNEIVHGLGMYNAKLADGYLHQRITISSPSFVDCQSVLEFKKRNGNNYKVIHLCDVITRFGGGKYFLQYNTSVYGKPKTSNELYKRLAKLKENINKMEMEAKQNKIIEKKLEIEKDFKEPRL